MTLSFLSRSATALLLCAGVAGLAHADPVKIRVGHGAAGEETLWLMKAAPQITPNQGKAYTLDYTLFRGADKRFQAFEAGELDLASSSTHSVIFAATQGLKFKAVASLSKESNAGFATEYMVMNNSPIKSIKDLKGKSIGNNGARSSSELWARMALEKNGLNSNRDVTWAIVPFPSQGEAVRSGKLDVGVFPQPFAAFEQQRGGMRTVFTSKAGNPRDEDLILLLASEDFAKKHPDALRAFLSDLVAASKYFRANPKAAKQALLDAKLVNVPADIYLNMKDYEVPADARIDVESMKHSRDDMAKYGFVKTSVDPTKSVDMSFLPK